MDQLGGVPVYDSREHFTLGKQIVGGTHEVQRAQNAFSKECVVLKRFALADARSRKTFEKELRTLARLQHPNIVQLAGVIYDRKAAVAFLEMPFQSNGNLREYYGASPENKTEFKSMFIAIVRALEYLHSNGVVHFDIKPDNVLVDENGTCLLTDFDVSKDAAARTLAVGAATTTAVSGMTLGYAAPEVVDAASAGSASTLGVVPPGSPADIWAAGCVLYFMALHPAEITLGASRTPVSKIPQHCPPDLRQILTAMWAVPADRRPTATDVLSAPYLIVPTQRELELASTLAAREKSLSVLTQHAQKSLPPVYWEARRLKAETPTRRLDVTHEMRDSIDWLMQRTAKPHFHGIGRDSHGATFATFGVVKVWRIENHRRWQAYALKREALKLDARAGGQPINPPIATDPYCMPSGALLDMAGSNERLLFHGTKKEGVDVICNRGFDERVSRLDGLFGPGCYFAENSSKSDEYVPPGPKQYMFLCRVLLGSPFVTTTPQKDMRRPPCVERHCSNPKCAHAQHDSLLAPCRALDAKACLERFREFVVYNGDQAYPEFLIEYVREVAGSRPPKKKAAASSDERVARKARVAAMVKKRDADHGDNIFGDDDDDTFV